MDQENIVVIFDLVDHLVNSAAGTLIGAASVILTAMPKLLF